MLQELSTTCPICEATVGNVKNHVRMSSDEDHGPQGRYPDGFEESSSSRGRPRTSSDLDPEEGEREVLEVRLEDDGDQEDGDDQEASSEEDLETLEIGDDPEDASNYHCGDCEARLEYHQEECECGGTPMWRVVN